MKKTAIYLVILVAALGAASCSRKNGPSAGNQPSPFLKYMPLHEGRAMVYRSRYDGEWMERRVYYEKSDGSAHVFRDNRGVTKAYRFAPDGLYLEGMAVMKEAEPYYFSGENASLRSPLETGAQWDIRAELKTQTALIRQKGRAEVLGFEKCRVPAGEYDAVKVLYNIVSEYEVHSGDQRSVISSHYIIWYGEDAGIIRQLGSALLERENRSVPLELELLGLEDVEKD